MKRQRDNPPRLRFAASRGFLRALKCTYEIHCAAHKELSIFESDRHVSWYLGHVPTRFGSEKPRDVLEKEEERNSRIRRFGRTRLLRLHCIHIYKYVCVSISYA